MYIFKNKKKNESEKIWLNKFLFFLNNNKKS